MNADQLLAELPLIAILRGLQPERAVDVAHILYETGIRVLEVPLNSPEPFRSIEALARLSGRDWLVGAGTVLSPADVQRTRDAGGGLVVAPNCNAEVIGTALRLGVEAMPGVATATECFSAIGAGAHLIKLFPASTYGPAHLKALSAVLPARVGVIPVGGIGAPDIPDWLAAGAVGFGFGSELFKPSYSLDEIRQRAIRSVAALRQARSPGEPV